MAKLTDWETRSRILDKIQDVAERIISEDEVDDELLDQFFEVADGLCDDKMQKARVSDVTRRIEGKPTLFWLYVVIEPITMTGLTALDMRRQIGMEDATKLSFPSMQSKKIPVSEIFARKFSAQYQDKDHASVYISGINALNSGLIKAKDAKKLDLDYGTVIFDEDVARKYTDEKWSKETKDA